MHGLRRMLKIISTRNYGKPIAAIMAIDMRGPFWLWFLKNVANFVSPWLRCWLWTCFYSICESSIMIHCSSKDSDRNIVDTRQALAEISQLLPY